MLARGFSAHIDSGVVVINEGLDIHEHPVFEIGYVILAMALKGLFQWDLPGCIPRSLFAVVAFVCDRWGKTPDPS